MSEPVTVPQADDLVGTVFKGLTWASAASWEQSGLTGRELGLQSLCKVAGCSWPGQGITHPEGPPKSDVDGFPTEQDVGLHWRVDRS